MVKIQSQSNIVWTNKIGLAYRESFNKKIQDQYNLREKHFQKLREDLFKKYRSIHYQNKNSFYDMVIEQFSSHKYSQIFDRNVDKEMSENTIGKHGLTNFAYRARQYNVRPPLLKVNNFYKYY